MNSRPTSTRRTLPVEPIDPAERELLNRMLDEMANMFPVQRAQELATAKAAMTQLGKRWVKVRRP